MQREIQHLSAMELFCPQRCRHAFKHCCASMNWQWGNHHHEVRWFIFMISWFSCYDWWNGAPLNWYPKISISQVFTSPVTTYQTRKQALAILIIFLMAGQSLAKRINHLLYTLTPYLLLKIYIFLILWLLFDTSFYQTNCMSALSCIYHKACCNHYVIYIKWIHGDRSKTITHYLILKRMNIPQSMRNPTNYSISPPKSYEIPTKSPPKYHKNPPDLILLKSAPDGTSRHCLVIAHRCQFPLVLARAWRGPFGWHGQLGIEWCGT